MNQFAVKCVFFKYNVVKLTYKTHWERAIYFHGIRR